MRIDITRRHTFASQDTPVVDNRSGNKDNLSERGRKEIDQKILDQLKLKKNETRGDGTPTTSSSTTEEKREDVEYGVECVLSTISSVAQLSAARARRTNRTKWGSYRSLGDGESVVSQWSNASFVRPIFASESNAETSSLSDGDILDSIEMANDDDPWKAAKRGDYEALRKFHCHSSIKWEIEDYFQNPPLFYACNSGAANDIRVVSFLLAVTPNIRRSLLERCRQNAVNEDVLRLLDGKNPTDTKVTTSKNSIVDDTSSINASSLTKSTFDESSVNASSTNASSTNASSTNARASSVNTSSINGSSANASSVNSLSSDVSSVGEFSIQKMFCLDSKGDADTTTASTSANDTGAEDNGKSKWADDDSSFLGNIGIQKSFDIALNDLLQRPQTNTEGEGSDDGSKGQHMSKEKDLDNCPVEQPELLRKLSTEPKDSSQPCSRLSMDRAFSRRKQRHLVKSQSRAQTSSQTRKTARTGLPPLPEKQPHCGGHSQHLQAIEEYHAPVWSDLKHPRSVANELGNYNSKNEKVSPSPSMTDGELEESPHYSNSQVSTTKRTKGNGYSNPVMTEKDRDSNQHQFGSKLTEFRIHRQDSPTIENRNKEKEMSIFLNQQISKGSDIPIIDFQETSNRWLIANHSSPEKSSCLSVHAYDANQEVHIHNCNGATIQIHGKKVKNLLIDHCSHVNVIFDSIGRTCKVSNCDNIAVNNTGLCRNFSINDTDEIKLVVTQKTMEVANLVTSDCSEVNVFVPNSYGSE